MLEFLLLQDQSALVFDVFRCLLQIARQLVSNQPLPFLLDLLELRVCPLWDLSVTSRKGDPREYPESDRGPAYAESGTSVVSR